jgi:hypothetical protein
MHSVNVINEVGSASNSRDQKIIAVRHSTRHVRTYERSLMDISLPKRSTERQECWMLNSGQDSRMAWAWALAGKYP